VRIVAWVIVILLLVASAATLIDALTTAHSVWLSIPMLILSGVFLGPAIVVLLALLGLFDLALEINGHRFEVQKREEA
jgi:hypothetical protein